MDESKYQLPPETRGQFGIETDEWTNAQRLFFSFDFLRSVSPETLVKVVNWVLNEREEYDAWFKEHSILVECPNLEVVTDHRTLDRNGYVYLLHSHGVYKIGRAKSIDDRIAQISPQLPYPIEIVHVIKTEDCISFELMLHTHFADKRLQGEWFELSDEDVLFIKGLPK